MFVHFILVERVTEEGEVGVILEGGLGGGEQLAFHILAVANAELGTLGVHLDLLASTDED